MHARTEGDPEQIKKLMIEQIYRPVLWVDCVRTLLDAGITRTVECGPGKVLSGLVKRIAKGTETYAIEDRDGLDNALSSVQ